jgi:hypothetical protein
MLHLLIRVSRAAILVLFLGSVDGRAWAAASELVAFSGAVGQGAAAVGGRGGDVYHITSLADYNEKKDERKVEGSLRDGIESAKGPRTIVFDVGGGIRLHAPLDIQTDKLTIAGQTAPGGITVWGYPLNIDKSHDIVVRYVRVRTGDFNASTIKKPLPGVKVREGKGAKDLDAGTANGVDVGRSERVILDHVSAAWGMDETLSVTHCRDVTVQHSLIAEGLNDSFHPKGRHGYGSLIRGELTEADQDSGAGGYTLYGNLWAFNTARNPSIGGQQRLEPGQSERERRRTDVNIVNNVIYWSLRPTHRSEFGQVRINLVGNYYIKAPGKVGDFIFDENYPATTLLYQEGNMLDGDQDATHNGKPVGMADDVAVSFKAFGREDKLIGPTHGKPFNFFASVASDVVPAERAYERVIRGVGSSLARDAIDSRIVQAVVHRTGSIIDTQEVFRDRGGQLAGIDDLVTQRRPTDFDTDGDGISDKFERAHGLNPNDAADRNGTQLSKAGYTNLEVYLDELASKARGGS